MNLNKAMILGRVTRDPEVKQMQSGAEVATFSIATNHVYTTKAGEKKETVSFHNCVVYGKAAQVVGKYVTKGQLLYVEGRINYREWVSKDNVKKNTTEIMVDKFEFGPKPQPKVQTTTQAQDYNEPEPAESAVDETADLDNIPF